MGGSGLGRVGRREKTKGWSSEAPVVQRKAKGSRQRSRRRSGPGSEKKIKRQ